MSNYADISTAETYFAGRLETEPWDSASDTDKEKALTQATNAIDRLNYKGEKTDSDQDNQFPRDNDSEVPDYIINACCELALTFLDGVDQEHEFNNMRVTSQSIDNVKTTYDRFSQPENILAGIPSIEAWRYLLPYLRDTKSVRRRRIT